MAINITLTDNIDKGIEARLKAIAESALSAEKRVAALQRSLSTLKGGKGGLSSVSGDIEKTISKGMTNNGRTGTKNVESALVTHARDMQKKRAEITKAFEEGFRKREAEIAKLVGTIERATATNFKNKDFNRLLGITPETSSRAQAAMQKMYNDVFGAHNITTSALSNNIASTIQRATGTGIKQSTARSRREMQDFYNNLFGTINLSTTAPRVNLQRTINQNTGADRRVSSASSLREQQAAYDRLFNAIGRTDTAQNRLTRTISQIRTSTSSANRGIIEMSDAMSRLERSTSFLRSDGLRWAKVMWSLAGATLTAGAIVAAGDAYTRLQNRLSLVAEDQASVNLLTKDMGKLAIESRQPLETTAKLYTRLDLAMKDMGRSQEDTGKLTEVISKSLQLTGATAGEAASAMLQLSQAFNKGKLDGDEFRSMMENAPVLADALAKSLKVTRGQLLKMAPEGKLTSKVLADAWIGALDTVREKYAKTRMTMEQGFTNLRTSMTMYLGELDKEIGLTNSLARAITALGANLDTLTFIFLAIAPIIAAFVGSKLIAGFGMLISYAGRTAVAIGAIRSPITVVAAGMVTLARNSLAAGSSMVGAFTSANTRAIALQLTVARLAAGMVALSGAASRAAGMVLGAFSFGNIALAITVAVAAAIAYGDQIEIVKDKNITLRDVTIAAFSEIGGFAADVFNTLYDTVADFFGFTSDGSMTTQDKLVSMFNTALAVGAIAIDSIVTLIMGMWTTIKLVTFAVGDAIYNTFALIVNSVTTLVNGAIESFNGLLAGANSILDFTGASKLLGNFGMIDPVKGMDYKNQSDQVEGYKRYTGAMETLELAKERVMEGAAERAKARSIAEGKRRAADAAQAKKFADATKALDKDKEKADKKAEKDAERRAVMIEKVINEQNRLITASKLYGDSVERENTVNELNDKLSEKRYATLTEGEKQRIRDLVSTRLAMERTGKATQDYYNKIVEPMQNYAASQAALSRLLGDGAISQGQYNVFLKDATDTMNSLTDSTFAATDALEKQQRMRDKFGADGAAASAVYEAVENQGKTGLVVSVQDAQRIDEAARSLYVYNKEQEAALSLYNETQQSLEDNGFSIDALRNGYDAGAISIDNYTRSLASLLAEQGKIQESMTGITDPFEPMRRGFYQFVAEMPSLGQAMSDAISSTLGTAIDNVASTMTEMILNFDAYAEKAAESLGRPVSTLDTLRYALGDIIKQIGTDMITAIIKMGVQWAIQAALSKSIEASASATTIATQTATATAVNAAWTAAAISASIATLGSASATGLTAYMGAQMAGKAMSLSNIAGFADGSGVLTGAGTTRSDSLIARLSVGERVMSAETVSRNSASLQAMSQGASFDNAQFGGRGDINIAIHNYNDGSSKKSSTGDASDAKLAEDIATMIDHRIHEYNREQQQQGYANYRNP